MPAGRILQLHRDLLDRQIVDLDGGLIGKIDDLEFDDDGAGNYFVSALLMGPGPLGARLGGRLGTWLSSIGHRLDGSPTPGTRRLSFGIVSRIGSAIEVTLHATELDASGLESWLDEHVVRRIPGSRHASE
jgi:hypothetical protein